MSLGYKWHRPAYEHEVVGFEKGVVIEDILGTETEVYDIRVKGERSAREEWEGDCDGTR
jgi:hypothetical protein